MTAVDDSELTYAFMRVQRLPESRMTQEAHSNPSRLTIGVLYGFRALMVLFVCNFHLWQQSWLAQQITIAGHTISFDYFTRSSYLFVDGMLLLSGFLLYLPHAQAAEAGAPAPDVGTFYWKALLMRIVPSYLASVLLLLVVALCRAARIGTAGEGIADALSAPVVHLHLFYANLCLHAAQRRAVDHQHRGAVLPAVSADCLLHAQKADADAVRHGRSGSAVSASS